MILCASSRCRIVGRHRDGCDTDCRGCLPRAAADGRNLCEICTRRVGEDAIQAAFLYAELAERLASSGGLEEKTSGTRDRGTTLNGKAVTARTLIRHTLVSWSLMISEERGIHPPRDTTAAMGEYLDKHQQWLSAHGTAGDCSDELHELAHGFPRRACYPNPAKVVDVGPCPEPGCGGELTAVVRAQDAMLPSEVTCSAPPEEGQLEPHTWTARHWEFVLGPAIEQAQAARLAALLAGELVAEAETRDRSRAA
jgi:hypothetical protein